MHHGPTRIHLADYSLRHRRDGNAGTTILYHLRNRRRSHSSSWMTAGRRELLGDGHRRRFRRGRRTFRGTSGRTEQRADLSRSTPRRADYATTDAGRRPGLGARLLARSDDARAGWYIADYSAFLFRAQVTEESYLFRHAPRGEPSSSPRHEGAAPPSTLGGGGLV